MKNVSLLLYALFGVGAYFGYVHLLHKQVSFCGALFGYTALTLVLGVIIFFTKIKKNSPQNDNVKTQIFWDSSKIFFMTFITNWSTLGVILIQSRDSKQDISFLTMLTGIYFYVQFYDLGKGLFLHDCLESSRASFDPNKVFRWCIGVGTIHDFLLGLNCVLALLILNFFDLFKDDELSENLMAVMIFLILAVVFWAQNFRFGVFFRGHKKYAYSFLSQFFDLVGCAIAFDLVLNQEMGNLGLLVGLVLGNFFKFLVNIGYGLIGVNWEITSKF